MAEWGDKIKAEELRALCSNFIVNATEPGAPNREFFAGLSENTVKQYVTAAKNIRQYIPHCDFITPKEAQSILASISKSRGDGAARAARSVTGPMWRYMVLHMEGIDALHSNPFLPTKVKAGGHIEAWTKEQVESVIGLWDISRAGKKSDSLYASTMAMILYDTGQRLGDALKMCMSDFDTGAFIGYQQKTNVLVKIPVTERLMDRIRYIRDHRHTGRLLQNAANLSGLVGFTEDWVDENRARYLFKKECRKACLDVPPLHGIRKAAVNRMIDAGATPYEVMGVTGHKTLSTVDLYGQDFNRSNAAARAMEKVAANGKRQ